MTSEPTDESPPNSHSTMPLSSNVSRRLCSLATQMSYRLDQGNGRCVYQIGVEDNGCHSLLSYPQIAASARVLEGIARSLNAIVVQRTMIQNEVPNDNINSKEGTDQLDTMNEIVRVDEPPVFGDGRYGGATESSHQHHDDCYVSPYYLQVPEEDANDENGGSQLQRRDGVYTRAELTIQRIETHLLDPVPMTEYLTVPNEKNKTPSLATNKDAVSNNKNENEESKDGEEKDEARSNSSKLTRSGSLTHGVGETLSSRNIRVAVVGNVDAGKSTMIGTLTTSLLDDGRGKCRTSIMKHRHEIESGRTSTSSTHLLGFRSTGQVISGSDKVRFKRKGDDEIARESYRVITLMDLAGHEKYLKTT